jgi:hypothetical protein
MKIEIKKCELTKEHLNEILDIISKAFNCEVGVLPPPDFNNPTVPVIRNIDYYHQSIAAKVGIKPDSLKQIFKKFSDGYLNVLKEAFLMEIAKDMDADYPDHILQSPELWFVNPLRFTPYKITNREGVEDVYRTLPLFRSKEECQTAIKLIDE